LIQEGNAHPRRADRGRSPPVASDPDDDIDHHPGPLPLALGIGEGSDAQAPLARAVVGGLTGSTLITLVLIPVVYSLFHPDPNGGCRIFAATAAQLGEVLMVALLPSWRPIQRPIGCNGGTPLQNPATVMLFVPDVRIIGGGSRSGQKNDVAIRSQLTKRHFLKFNPNALPLIFAIDRQVRQVAAEVKIGNGPCNADQ
jgi:hypothetical protein